MKIFRSVLFIGMLSLIKALPCHSEESSVSTDFLGNPSIPSVLIELGLGFKGSVNDIQRIVPGQFDVSFRFGYGPSRSLIFETGIDLGIGPLEKDIIDYKQKSYFFNENDVMSISFFMPVGVRSSYTLSSIPWIASLGIGYLFGYTRDLLSNNEMSSSSDDYPYDSRNGHGFYSQMNFLYTFKQNPNDILFGTIGISLGYSHLVTMGKGFTECLYGQEKNVNLQDGRYTINICLVAYRQKQAKVVIR